MADSRFGTSSADGLDAARKAARDCRNCDLWERATQTVFGEGPRRARIMLIGEQPGDVEDEQGRPFVGPAGRVLDRALQESGIDRGDVYLTNVVKHFKWVARGKRRIHDKPNEREVAACRPWLETEIAEVQPRAIVLLGATAARALIGPSFRVTKERGVPIDSPLADLVVATVHPSSVLRAPDPAARKAQMAAFAADLGRVVTLLGQNVTPA